MGRQMTRKRPDMFRNKSQISRRPQTGPHVSARFRTRPHTPARLGMLGLTSSPAGSRGRPIRPRSLPICRNMGKLCFKDPEVGQIALVRSSRRGPEGLQRAAKAALRHPPRPPATDFYETNVKPLVYGLGLPRVGGGVCPPLVGDGCWAFILFILQHI